MTIQMLLHKKKSKHFIFIGLVLEARIHEINSSRDFVMRGIIWP